MPIKATVLRGHMVIFILLFFICYGLICYYIVRQTLSSRKEIIVSCEKRMKNSVFVLVTVLLSHCNPSSLND